MCWILGLSVFAPFFSVFVLIVFVCLFVCLFVCWLLLLLVFALVLFFQSLLCISKRKSVFALSIFFFFKKKKVCLFTNLALLGARKYQSRSPQLSATPANQSFFQTHTLSLICQTLPLGANKFKLPHALLSKNPSTLLHYLSLPELC